MCLSKTCNAIVSILRSLVRRLRKIYWNALGLKFGRNCQFDRFRANSPQNIQIGDRTTIKHDVDILYVGSAVDHPRIKIGSDCYIGQRVLLNCTDEVVIGDHVMIASGCQLVDCDHTFETRLIPIGRQPGKALPITLARDVWLGANVVVLRGVSIGEGAIVGAGSIVTRSIPSWEIWAGVPARKIGARP